eukprot:6084260-Lingulodinium_polyedra.AAC.1
MPSLNAALVRSAWPVAEWHDHISNDKSPGTRRHALESRAQLDNWNAGASLCNNARKESHHH